MYGTQKITEFKEYELICNKEPKPLVFQDEKLLNQRLLTACIPTGCEWKVRIREVLETRLEGPWQEHTPDIA